MDRNVYMEGPWSKLGFKFNLDLFLVDFVGLL